MSSVYKSPLEKALLRKSEIVFTILITTTTGTRIVFTTVLITL